MNGNISWISTAFVLIALIPGSALGVSSCSLFEPLDGYSDDVDSSPITIEPSEAHFANATDSVTFSLENKSTNTVASISVRINDVADKSAFIVVQNKCNGVNLSANKSCQVEITYAPNQMEATQATLEVFSEGKLVGSANLEGTGLGL